MGSMEDALLATVQGRVMSNHTHVICPACSGCRLGGCDIRSCSCATNPNNR